MKLINDDDFEFVFGKPLTQGSAQPHYGPNLPPESPPQAPTCGCPHGHGGQPNNENKGLNFYHPDDLNSAIDQVLKEMELQENSHKCPNV
jgi:hypothetical protein